MKNCLPGLLLVIAGCTEPASVEEVSSRELFVEARNLASLHGDSIWAGFSSAPFGLLLVKKETEQLFCHAGPPSGFAIVGIDPVLECPSAVRANSFPADIVASFPAIDGIPTIVIGTPGALSKSPDEWVLTILHEHFHQLQFAWPGYYQGTTDLGLSGGDESGTWILNYPFPYDQEETVDAFAVMAERLLQVLNDRQSDAFDASLKNYWSARESARSTVSDADWRYIELQFWQEGVARWTEGGIAVLSEQHAAPARQAEARILRELASLDLATQRRTAVYPLGAAEAMLLEAGGSDWRAAYWSEPFSLGPQLHKLLQD